MSVQTILFLDTYSHPPFFGGGTHSCYSRIVPGITRNQTQGKVARQMLYHWATSLAPFLQGRGMSGIPPEKHIFSYIKLVLLIFYNQVINSYDWESSFFRLLDYPKIIVYIYHRGSGMLRLNDSSACQGFYFYSTEERYSDVRKIQQ